MDRSVLPIQGPPGAGKTFTGARMICQLVNQGKKVGITAVSHKVIRKLLDEVLKTCAGRIRLDVELKEDGYVPDVMAAIRAAVDVKQVVVTSFLAAVVAQAKDALPEAPR